MILVMLPDKAHSQADGDMQCTDLTAAASSVLPKQRHLTIGVCWQDRSNDCEAADKAGTALVMLQVLEAMTYLQCCRYAAAQPACA